MKKSYSSHALAYFAARKAFRQAMREEENFQRAAFAMDPDGLAGKEALARLQRKVAKVAGYSKTKLP